MQQYVAKLSEPIQTAAKNMVAIAERENTQVNTVFNGITIEASPGDLSENIVTGFYAKAEEQRKQYEASPEGQAAARAAEAGRVRAEAAAKEGIKSFSVRDEVAWQSAVVANNTDGYSASALRFTARWANLMEQEIAKGSKLEDIAEQTGREADIEGITGFQYGWCVSVLAAVWKHGEQLRRWHNLKYQVRGEGEKANKEGGVLNPAVLTVGLH